MQTKTLSTIAGLIFTLTLLQTANAQTAKVASSIKYLVKEANQPDYHSADDKCSLLILFDALGAPTLLGYLIFR